LKFNERDILENAGKIAMEVAQELALRQYEIFHTCRLREEAIEEILADEADLQRIATRLEEKKTDHGEGDSARGTPLAIKDDKR